jgi:hypothetical protein
MAFQDRHYLNGAKPILAAGSTTRVMRRFTVCSTEMITHFPKSGTLHAVEKSIRSCTVPIGERAIAERRRNLLLPRLALSRFLPPSFSGLAVVRYSQPKAIWRYLPVRRFPVQEQVIYILVLARRQGLSVHLQSTQTTMDDTLWIPKKQSLAKPA